MLLVSIVSYVFVKHQVVNISIVLKPKVLIVAEALAVITSCYFAILLLTRLFTGGLHYLLAALLVAVFSVFAGSFVYFQKRMEREVKKTLFRESHDAYETLMAFSETLVTILELKSLTGEIVRTLEEVLGARRALSISLTRTKVSMFFTPPLARTHIGYRSCVSETMMHW